MGAPFDASVGWTVGALRDHRRVAPVCSGAAVPAAAVHMTEVTGIVLAGGRRAG
jgi:hypothetical protein